MLESGSIGLATAFAAGVISFLSPCVLPLVPGYLSYVAGSSLESLRDQHGVRLRALGYAVCFVLGFSVVFVALGASATALGGLLLSWRYELGILAGIVVLLFGLHLAGLLPIHLLEREARFHADIRGGRVIGAFLLGFAFAFGWTPCIGPVLGVILTMSASSADLATGTGLLAVYSLGLGLPFLLAALFTDSGQLPQGQIALRDVYSAYIYDNTLYVLEINGDILRRALEKDAEYFIQVDPAALPADPKGIVAANARDYNWDIYTGVDYTIDISNPAAPVVTDSMILNTRRVNDIMSTPDGKFRSYAPQRSGNYVHRFDVEGDFPYFCETHCEDGMKGIVRVVK